jgi:hypothetical protein
MISAYYSKYPNPKYTQKANEDAIPGAVLQGLH